MSTSESAKAVSNDCKLFIGNLPFAVKESDLEELFGRFGAVQGVNIRKDRTTGKPKGFAFVTLEDAGAALEAKERLHGSAFGGRTLTVNFADARGGGGGGDRDAEGVAGGAATTTATADSSWKTVPTPRKTQASAGANSSSSASSSGSKPQRRTWDEWAGPSTK